jgi:hypothetical protein
MLSIKERDRRRKQLHDKMKPIQAELDAYSRELTRLNIQFVLECNHPQNHIHMDENVYEDEYGYWMQSWTDYNYWCTRCNTKLRKVKKFKDIKTLQLALSDKAKELYND